MGRRIHREVLSDSTSRAACADCGAPLAGPYCAQCGQRRFDDRDRRLPALLGDFWHELTSFDGKLWRSLLALWFRPGHLTREWFEGRRARWAKPVSLFLIANLLYFFSPAMTDFNLSFRDQVPGRLVVSTIDPAAPDAAAQRERSLRYSGQMHSAVTAGWVERRIAARAAAQPGYDVDDYARAYDRESDSLSKLLIIVHVPLLAAALALLFRDRRRYFAEHFVAALHLFAFLLFVLQLVVAPFAWLVRHAAEGWPGATRVVVVVLATLVVAYWSAAVGRAYGTGFVRATVSGFVLATALVFANLAVYRAVQFAVVFALT